MYKAEGAAGVALGIAVGAGVWVAGAWASCAGKGVAVATWAIFGAEVAVTRTISGSFGVHAAKYRLNPKIAQTNLDI